MRDTFFRGKRIDNGEWVEGYYIYHKNADNGEIYWESDPDWQGYYADDIFVVDVTTVGQYTGITDKNGKKIFEGDIVGTRIWSEFDDTTVWCEGPVIFENGGFFIKISEYVSVAIGEERYEEPYFRILGNICDNPELIHS